MHHPAIFLQITIVISLSNIEDACRGAASVDIDVQDIAGLYACPAPSTI